MKSATFLHAALLALSLVGLAHAQTTVAVSNLTNINSTSVLIGQQDGFAATRIAARFTTGAVPTTLESVSLDFFAATGAPTGFTLQLYEAFSLNGGPSGLAATFNVPVNPSGLGNFSFTGTAALDANTSYFLVASAPGTSGTGSGTFYHWVVEHSFHPNAVGLTGWSIDDGYYFFTGDSAPAWGENPNLTPQFSVTVSAAAVPEPSTYAAIVGAVALGLVWLRRRSSTLDQASD